MKVNIKALNAGARMPTYESPGAACFDLYSCGKINFLGGVDPVTTFMFRDNPVFFGTGLSFEIPVGYVMLIFSRREDGIKNDIRLSSCVGRVDSDDTGEVIVKLNRDLHAHNHPVVVNSGERIAQAMIIPVDRVEFGWVDQLGVEGG